MAFARVEGSGVCEADGLDDVGQLGLAIVDFERLQVVAATARCLVAGLRDRL